MSRRIGDDVYKAPVRVGDAFASAIVAWLEADERRRVLLLIDEADKFVRNESETGFKCIQTMLQLMAETKHRFKFVLAGLHNVSRAIRAENSPLVQISNNPLQIGPLLNRDVDDAEFLVRGPLAAMGFEFDSREDVWRILSFTNYYPVLIQVFCKELLRLLHEQVQQTGRIPTNISTALVERALSSSDVRSKLFASFEGTIASIENRYELITYILAARELVERDSGMDAEGMSTAEVADRAMECWPAAFQRGSDSLELEYLLEEMEGFGIARRTISGGFALRSRSLLELMVTSEAELTRKLAGFKNLPQPPKHFDPKNFRRSLGKVSGRTESEGKISPLTDGQEADLLAPATPNVGSGPTEGVSGIGVIFGTEYAGIRYVEPALLDARRVKDKLVDIDIKTFAAKKDMLDEAKKAPKGERTRVIVVSAKTSWRPDWVVDAERVGRVRKGEVRLVFVGEPQHARIWAAQASVLLPFTHRILRSLIARYHDVLSRTVSAAHPYVKRYNDREFVITDPYKLEFYDFKELTKNHLSPVEHALIKITSWARNAVAHCDVIPPGQIELLSDHYESNRDLLDGDIPGWNWPRCGQTMILTVGPSGAGKSRWCEAQGIEIVSSDEIRSRISPDLEVAGNQAGIFRQVRTNSSRILASGRDVIVDAMHVEAQHRQRQSSVAPPDVRIRYVIVDRPLAEKVRDAGWRKEKGLVEKYDGAFSAQVEAALKGDNRPGVEIIDIRE
jgi:predicted kinase